MGRILFVTAIFLSVFSLTPAIAASPDCADLILFHGVVRSMDLKDSTSTAIAVRGDKVLLLGSDQIAMAKACPDARRVDLKGRLALPGLFESHAHLKNLGLLRLQLDLTGTRSFDEVLQKVRERVKELKKGEWLIGFGWDQTLWQDKVFPTHEKLSAVSPDNPVLLTRVDYHTHLANQTAMALAGLSEKTPDPSGGKLVREKDGKPTGILMDKARDLMDPVVPQTGPEAVEKAVKTAIREALRDGITTFNTAYALKEEVDALRRMGERGELPIRVYAMLAADEKDVVDAQLAKGPEIGLYNNHLTIRAVKIIADGGLGAHSAALLHPYHDDPTNQGLLRVSEDDIYQLSKRAVKAGFQVAVHAVGDRTTRMILNAYERAFADTKAKKGLRFRIEHASVVDPADIPRFGQLGLIAAVQPCFCRTQCRYVGERVGSELAEEGAFAFQSLRRTGARVVGSSDAPIEPVDPLLGIYAAVSRRSADGTPPEGWFPAQKLSIEEAVEMYTRDASYATFEEKTKGTLEAGKLADITVLSADIFSNPLSTLPKTHADMTIVGGKVVYERR